MIKKYKDVIAGACIIAFAGLMFIGISQIKVLSMIAASNSVDARFFPAIAAVALVILGAVILVGGLKSAKEYDPSREEAAAPGGGGVVILTLVCIALYVFFSDILGFLIASFGFLVAEMAILAPKEKRNWVLFIMISAISSSAIYFFFTKVLYLMLPAGILR